MDATRPFSRRNPQRKRRPSTITIPAHVAPAVALVFSEMKRQRIRYDDIEETSGTLRTTLKAWRHKNSPSLTNLAAVLGALGWDFVPVPRAKVLPPALAAALAPIADEFGLALPDAAEALTLMVARGHEPPPPDLAA